MKYIGMPMGMWVVFAGSFRRICMMNITETLSER